MPALAANPNFRVYDVVDKATISSGLSAAMSLEDPQINGYGVLRVIGEPTGGAGQGYGNAVAFTLPASNLTGQYATKFISLPTYISSGDSFLPDIVVPVRSTDYFARYDPVMGSILARMDYPPDGPSGDVITVNAASFRSEQGLAPGGLASAFGNFGATPDQVLLAGLSGQIVAATPTQVNFIVPAAVTPGPVSISVRAAGKELGTGQATIVAASLGIFVLQPGDPSQPGAVENQDSSVNQDASPAVIGSVIQIFATGNVPDPNAVQVFFMDTPAQITYSGPVAPGLWQINAQVPATASGQLPVFVVAGGIPSNAVTVWVH